MTRAHKMNIAGKTAIIAALMGGSSLSFAQDAAPTVTAPDQPAPIVSPTPTPVVTPPPAVSTLPSPNDVINRVAAQEAAAEAAPERQKSAAPKAPARSRGVAPATAAPAVAIAPDPVSEPSTDIVPPAVDAIEAAGATIEDKAPIAPVDDPVARDAGVSTEDLTLIGGLAAALAAIGLGAAFASRRKRKIVADQPQMDPHRDFVAPAPIKHDPAFKQFAANTAPVVPAMAAPIGQRPVKPVPVVTRPDIPVTDPLFSRTVAQTPITDPLFAPRNDVEIPITDPMFAHLSGYNGNSASSKSVWTYDNRQNRTMTGQVNERASDEMEPAE